MFFQNHSMAGGDGSKPVAIMQKHTFQTSFAAVDEQTPFLRLGFWQTHRQKEIAVIVAKHKIILFTKILNKYHLSFDIICFWFPN